MARPRTQWRAMCSSGRRAGIKLAAPVMWPSSLPRRASGCASPSRYFVLYQFRLQMQMQRDIDFYSRVYLHFVALHARRTGTMSCGLRDRSAMAARFAPASLRRASTRFMRITFSVGCACRTADCVQFAEKMLRLSLNFAEFLAISMNCKRWEIVHEY